MNKLVFVFSVALATCAVSSAAPARACASCGGGGGVQVSPQVQSNSAAQAQSSSAAEGGNGGMGGSGGNVTSNPTAIGGNPTAYASGGDVNLFTPPTSASSSIGRGLTVLAPSATATVSRVSPDGASVTLSVTCPVGEVVAGVGADFTRPDLFAIGGRLEVRHIPGGLRPCSETLAEGLRWAQK